RRASGVKRHLGLALGVGLVTLARAAGLTVGGVNRVEFWAFQKDWAYVVEDKMELNARYGDFSGNLGLFLFEPSKPWVGLRQSQRFLDYTVAYSPKQFEILYGRYFQTFGKGLALRTYSDEDFRHYKSLHGIRGIARLPMRTEVVMLSGRLRDVFFQENTYKILNLADTSDQVVGVDLVTRSLGPIGLGGRYVRVNRTNDLTPKAFSELFGGNVSANAGLLDVELEVCQRLGTRPAVGGRDRGFGYYFSGTASLAGFSVLAEYMDYDRLALPLEISPGNLGLYHYNDPPTPIKSGVAINRGADEQGYGVTLSATPLGPLYLEGNFGRLATHDNRTARVMEWEGKGRYSLGVAWTLEGKLNHSLQENVELHVKSRKSDKPVLQVNWAGGQQTLALEAEYAFISELTDTVGQTEPWNYHETALALSYGYGAGLLFTLGWQSVDRALAQRYNNERMWPLFETVWTITERNVLRVRIGAERGGYTCSGGVCRFEAPFRGVKLQLISRF
ncbi:MAG: DUF6029 family protein, partial [candidate division WOR-3 bacterium]